MKSGMKTEAEAAAAAGRRMKGMAPEVLLVMTVIVMFIVLGSLIMNVFTVFSRADVEETESTYFLVNALKAAKLYAETSLDYSVYQAAYNNSRHGGYSGVSQARRMTDELLPMCKRSMDRSAGCAAGKESGAPIRTGLKKGVLDAYPVGLLQCVLSRLRTSGGSAFEGASPDQLGQADCDFGDTTEKGVKGFQKDRGLPETGEVDGRTLDKLKEAFQAKWGDCGSFFSGCPNRIESLAFWESQGAPSEAKVLAELRKAAAAWMGKYTAEDYLFMDDMVRLPAYGEAGLAIEKSAGFIRAKLSSSDPISIIKDAETNERIVLSKSSNIERTYPIRYSDMYAAGSAAFSAVLGEIRSKGCGSFPPGTMMKNAEHVSGFLVDAEVFDRDSQAQCSLAVKITVKDASAAYPVFSGEGVSFEPISLVFMAGAGGLAPARRPPSQTPQTSPPSGPAGGKALLLGDSLTVGYSGYLTGPACGAAALSHVGWKTSDMLAELQRSDLSSYSAIVLLGGVNDIASGIPVGQIETNIGEIERYAAGQGKRVIHVSILPWAGYTTWTSQKQEYTEQLNLWLNSTYGSSFVDAYERLEYGDTDALASDYDGGDHLHLNSGGYGDLAQRVAQSLSAAGVSCQSAG